jgi:hypothetical protein
LHLASKKKAKTSKIEFWPYQQIGGDISVPGIIDKTGCTKPQAILA